MNLLMLQLQFFVANVAFTRFFVANVVIMRFFCRKCRDYALFGVEFYAEFLAEILRNTQNFGRNSAEKIGRWSLMIDLELSKGVSIVTDYINSQTMLSS